MSVRINYVRFTNFKALEDFTVNFSETNILVGPNNAGKSTILSVFRILDISLRRARRKTAEIIKKIDGNYGPGHHIPEENIGVSLENVASDYNEKDSIIEFVLTNRNKLYLYFPNRSGCILYWECEAKNVQRPKDFREEFPVIIKSIPVLGPFEHEEKTLAENTVKSSLYSHRASRHFRNYWYLCISSA